MKNGGGSGGRWRMVVVMVLHGGWCCMVVMMVVEDGGWWVVGGGGGDGGGGTRGTTLQVPSNTEYRSKYKSGSISKVSLSETAKTDFCFEGGPPAKVPKMGESRGGPDRRSHPNTY